MPDKIETSRIMKTRGVEIKKKKLTFIRQQKELI